MLHAALKTGLLAVKAKNAHDSRKTRKVNQAEFERTQQMQREAALAQQQAAMAQSDYYAQLQGVNGQGQQVVVRVHTPPAVGTSTSVTNPIAIPAVGTSTSVTNPIAIPAVGTITSVTNPVTTPVVGTITSVTKTVANPAVGTITSVTNPVAAHSTPTVLQAPPVASDAAAATVIEGINGTLLQGDQKGEGPASASSAEGALFCVSNPVLKQPTTTTGSSFKSEGADVYGIEEDQGIPDRFLRLLCCAVTCCNLEAPSCWGGATAISCLCCDCSVMCCRFFKDENENTTRMMCCASDVALANPDGLCKIYDHCCCIEILLAFPLITESYTNTHAAAGHKNGGIGRDAKAVSNDVTVCKGLCCLITSCDLSFPSCLGCSTKGVCCCTEVSTVLCKPACGTYDDDKSLLCAILNTNVICGKPTSCCKVMGQLCCLSHRCAIPCDDDVPCICTALPFCTCFVNGQFRLDCCKTINQLKEDPSAVEET